MPQANNTEKIVAISNPHLYGPGTMIKPRIKRKQIIAPIYTGPEVNAFSPQYVGAAWQNCLALFLGILALTNSLYNIDLSPTL